jgi:hypothetical protein
MIDELEKIRGNYLSLQEIEEKIRGLLWFIVWVLTSSTKSYTKITDMVFLIYSGVMVESVIYDSNILQYSPI